MKEEILLLLKLQEADTGLRTLAGEIDEIPKTVKVLEEDVKKFEEACNAGKKKLEDMLKQRRDKERDVEASSEQQKKFERQLFDVKKNDEYQALLHEIEQARKKRSDIETVIIEILESEEKLAEELKMSSARLKAAQEKVAVEKTRLEKELEEAKQRMQKLTIERGELASGLNPGMRSRYERILEGKGGQAISEVKKGGCGGCFTVLPPQMVNEVKKQEKLITCEACGRILVWIDSEPVKQPE